MRKYIVSALLVLSIYPSHIYPAESVNTVSKAKRCLAEAIYRESRGEPYLGKLAVGQVVLNRVGHKNYPNSICAVVFQKHQFSWTRNWSAFEAPPEFLDLARKILRGEHSLRNFNATHFHANYVSPKWGRKLRKVRVIGKHIFYR